MATYFDTAKVDAFDARMVADTAEIQLLASGEPYLSYGEYRALYPAGSEPPATEIELGLSEVVARGLAMGTLYPFEFDGQGVRIDRSGPWQLYALLLILSFRGTPFRDDKDWKRSDPLFDAVVLRAVNHKYSNALHFGWPPQGDRPTTFPEALAWAAETMGLTLRSEGQPLPTHRQDGGVDVIAWTPYADGANGYPVVLVQNTIQQHYVHKPGEADPLLWRDWIAFGGTPGVALAVPFVVDKDDPWRPQVLSRLSDFMDRTRLVEILATEDPRHWSEWDEMVTFVDEQLHQIRADSEGSSSSLAPSKARRKKARPPRLD